MNVVLFFDREMSCVGFFAKNAEDEVPQLLYFDLLSGLFDQGGQYLLA